MVSHDASQGKSVHAVPFFVHVKVADGHVKQPVVQHTATIAATAVMVIVTAASGGGSAASGGGAIAGSTRKEDTTTTGQGLGIGEAKGPGLGLGLSLASTGKGVTISVREVLAWAAFVSQWVRLMGCEEDGVMDVSSTSNHPHQPLASSSSSSSSSSSISSPLSFATTVYAGVLHGAHMVVLDGLGIGLTAPRETIRALKQAVKH